MRLPAAVWHLALKDFARVVLVVMGVCDPYVCRRLVGSTFLHQTIVVRWWRWRRPVMAAMRGGDVVMG
ncbi:hypothetical protein E2C01_040814 [Portunus trituberculatus]|uniref:Uncharacterized protein n=1 Tax=Portunus trituberculatus TaxID=210409 RepID=A0A5B7FP82_PORTR|nr:hypothetical protein [Portunus trituberculatus]